MKHLISAILPLYVFATLITANPIATYDLPFISEVQVTDSTEWSIELNCFCNDWYSLNFNEDMVPCSTNAFKLRLTSSGDTFNTALFFNKYGIAVISRESITDISDDTPVKIADFDTIQVLDCNVDEGSIDGYWSFAVRPIKPGSSLFDSRGEIVETSRPGIGSEKINVTRHEIFVSDSQYPAISTFYAYGGYYEDEYPGGHHTEYLGQTDSGKFSVDASIIDRSRQIAFSCNKISLKEPIMFAPDGTFLKTFSYIDSMPIAEDTVYCLCQTNGIEKSTSRNQTNLRFNALNQHGKKIVAVITTKTAVLSTAIELYSVSGKKVASKVLSAMPQSGTYTFEFEPGSEISTGKYVCRLIADKAVIAMQTITLF
jgi:hypothetical protein